MAGQQPAPGSANEPISEPKATGAVRKAGKVVKSTCKRVAMAHGLESGVLDTTQNLTKQKVRRREKIINMAWYAFLIVMLYIGGSATIGWIVNGGYRWGYRDGRLASTAVVAPASTPASVVRVEVPEIGRVASAIEEIAEQSRGPSSPPQVAEQVVQVPVSVPVVAVRPPAQLTDAERRDQALKDLLRRRNGLSP